MSDATKGRAKWIQAVLFSLYQAVQLHLLANLETMNGSQLVQII